MKFISEDANWEVVALISALGTSNSSTLATIAYKASSRTVKATQRNFVLKKKTKPNQNNKNKTKQNNNKTMHYMDNNKTKGKKRDTLSPLIEKRI